MTIEDAFLTEALGALWDRETIAANRVRPEDVPPLRRLIVGIDPATTSKRTSDETGIILFGLGQDDHGYVFADRTGRYSPLAWANQALALAQMGHGGHPADLITAETNQGGEMVESVLRQAGSHFPYKGTHVLQGKRARAEPVAHLYAMGRIHHVGVLPGLENEMCSWNAQTKMDSSGIMKQADDKSPNRIDSLTRCVHELMNVGEPGIIAYYAGLAEQVKLVQSNENKPDEKKHLLPLPEKNIFNTFELADEWKRTINQA